MTLKESLERRRNIQYDTPFSLTYREPEPVECYSMGMREMWLKGLLHPLQKALFSLA